jgi:DNA-binding response OmpR family regulator
MSSAPAILIVEDEPLIAMMLEDFLDMLGYRLAGVCDNVDEALGLVSQGAFDAAILDVNLRNGEASWPIADAMGDAGKPFVIATGGQEDAHPPRHAGVPVLSKPFTLDSVKSSLDTLLVN